MKRNRIWIFPAAFFLLTLMMSTTAFASNSAMGDFGASWGLQGNTDVYYSAPWLVSFVQWFISWSCIIAFLAYYMSYLCSIVVLSNKELFYTIDALKRDKENSGGGDKARNGPFNGLFAKFREGSAEAGLNGGADNFIVFFLMLSINFKAISVYKNVEAGSEGNAGGGGNGGNGPKYAYSDSMAAFFLKSLPDSIIFTFIVSIALSGLLIRMWFTVGDVLIIKAERFAQTNLSAKLDQILGVEFGYTFTLAQSNTRGGQVAESVARKIYATIVAEFPDITEDQLLVIGLEVENAVYGTGVPASGPASSILGTDPRGYDTITDIINATKYDGEKIERISSEQTMQGVSLARVAFTTSDDTKNNTQVVYSIDEILERAGTRPARGKTGLYAHITLYYNTVAANNQVYND